MVIPSNVKLSCWKNIKKYSRCLVLVGFFCALCSIVTIFNNMHYANSSVKFSTTDVIYEMRAQSAQTQCELSGIGNVGEVYLLPQSRLEYCPLAKIGSTFWKRVFLFLSNDTGKHHVKTPFQIPRDFVHYGTKVRTQILNSNASIQEKILNNYTRFMFVRDPYSRLWSAYLDKFFLPDFWRSYALIITKKRMVLTEKAKRCGNDVSFLEFLEYVASLAPISMNEHWQPIKYKCDPCQFKPDIIGKQETFREDARYVLGKAGQSWIMESSNSGAHAEEEIEMLIEYNFNLIRTLKDFYQNCTNKFDVARRLWQVFQLNGYLPMNQRFEEAMKPFERAYLDRNIFKDCVMRTLQMFSTTERRKWKNHRRQAMAGAYETIPKLLLRRIKEIYRKDFEAFGYSMKTPRAS